MFYAIMRQTHSQFRPLSPSLQLADVTLSPTVHRASHPLVLYIRRSPIGRMRGGWWRGRCSRYGWVSACPPDLLVFGNEHQTVPVGQLPFKEDLVDATRVRVVRSVFAFFCVYIGARALILLLLSLAEGLSFYQSTCNGTGAV